MDGILIINKEKNYTSNDVVRKVKKILNCSKVGHTGTLDPNATGVLPLLLGNATKISKYIINHDKEYEAILKLGIKTATADGEGEILEEKDVDAESINEENVKNVLQSFIGEYKQVPPIYSAIKVNGKKLYQYARNGEKIDIEPRIVEIYEMKLNSINEIEKEISFSVKCSKGTYIRTLCEDIAKKLNNIGYMKDLKRISVGEFNIENSIKIEDLEKKVISNIDFEDEKCIMSMEKFFEDKESFSINDENIFNKYINGVKIKLKNKNDGIYKIYHNDVFIGIGICENNELKRDLVIANYMSFKKFNV